MVTLRNDRSGEVIETPLTLDELAAEFAASVPESHWLWYYIARVTGQGQSNRVIQMPGSSECGQFLADSFLYAIGMGLERPMIRLYHRTDDQVTTDKRYKIYLSKRGTICVKAGNVRRGTNNPTGSEVYLGCFISRNGSGFLEPQTRKLLPDEKSFLDSFMADPVGVMAQTGKDVNRCCYCTSPLEDDRSRQAGYGPICAARWGLPWGHVGTDHKFRSFAELWADSPTDVQRSIRGVCKSLRSNPHDEFLWGVLGDILEENGHAKRPSAPTKAGIVIPAV